MKNINDSKETKQECNVHLISVVIATFNYGRFIEKAIQSIYSQTYPHVEVIVVDDGSTDDTFDIVARHPRVRYYYQGNQGVSAARNLGIKHAKGDYITFLDADDWLLPEALALNYSLISKRMDLAFVSGCYHLHTVETNQTENIQALVEDNHYCWLLEKNYIGMLAAVLFRTNILRAYCFDPSVKACEDYDLFLSIARNHPVLHHGASIAVYYHHENGLSHKYQLMSDSIGKIFSKQKKHLKNASEKIAFAKGCLQWLEYQKLADDEN